VAAFGASVERRCDDRNCARNDGAGDRHQVAAAEWADAARFELPDGGAALLGTDGETLFLAVEDVPEAKFGFGCLFVAAGNDVWVLHASAQLGSALYKPRGATWSPENQKYVWKKADVVWREEQWRAGVSPKRAQEFAVSLQRLGAEPRIALGYILLRGRKPEAFGWPAGLNDATRDTQLLSGFNPDGLTFQTGLWARLLLP